MEIGKEPFGCGCGCACFKNRKWKEGRSLGSRGDWLKMIRVIGRGQHFNMVLAVRVELRRERSVRGEKDEEEEEEEER